MRATLTFTEPGHVMPDAERSGLLRADFAAEDGTGDVRGCELTDLSAPGTTEPGLEAAGFETIDLEANTALQRALDDVRRRDRLTGDAEAAIRQSLTGMEVALANGTRLRIDLVVDDGLFYRRSGPAWTDVNPGGIDGVNGHGGAKYVHGDQDVYGTPLRQLMHGTAPDTFRHVTPDGRNDDATTFLLNLWIPIHAPVQPLALMDQRTVDGVRHQLRFGLPVDGFLERDEDAEINDIWRFLYHPDQQWFARTDMDSRQGYLFNTLGTGHGAACLAGEDALAPLFLALSEAVGAIESGDTDPTMATIDVSTPEPPGDASGAIRDAWKRLTRQVDAANAIIAGSGSDALWDEWRIQTREALDSVVRRSVELRLVASVIDDD
ncbi:MAG: hypothetical protein R2707_18820 [Acidimicrobiales bacterium]